MNRVCYGIVNLLKQYELSSFKIKLILLNDNFS